MEQIIKYSVVIPIYNSEKYLEQSIDSVINQKCDSSFEIILVNDGSTDHSGEICDRYVTLFPGEVQAIHQENKGLLMARREGLKHTRGVYVMHLDSDDYLREGALDVIDQALRNTNADILLFQASRHENFRIPFAELPFKNGEIIEITKSKTPELLKAPIATNKPIRVGKILTTISIPSFAPSKKTSNIFIFSAKP